MRKRSVMIDCLLSFGAYTLTLFIQLDSYLFTTLLTDSYLIATWLVTYMDSISRSLFIWTPNLILLGL
jgi:hypothetical protein